MHACALCINTPHFEGCMAINCLGIHSRVAWTAFVCALIKKNGLWKVQSFFWAILGGIIQLKPLYQELCINKMELL